jgi:phenylalanyl-tRNA synthetase alpha chain
MLDQIEDLKKEISSYTISSAEELESFRLEFISRNGKIQTMFGQIGSVPKEERAAVGKNMNEAKNLAQQKFDEAKQALTATQSSSRKATDDLTLTAPVTELGSLHPLTQTLNEIKQIFYRLGFTIADGPELEDDFHNFTALNFPPDHPARDMQDTFFVRKNDEACDDDLILRTHTSPVQIRLMLEEKPPLRAIMPGKVYRNESITAKSYCLFHQVEGLYVDKDISVAHLKETLITFVKMMYGNDVKYRLRPSFFPFTEPSMEMDIWWDAKGDGQWLEILGAGMVDPNVFKAVNVDPEVYSGFAFGMGVERITMLKYGMEDIRTFYDNDIRFLKQFSI